MMMTEFLRIFADSKSLGLVDVFYVNSKIKVK